VGTDVPTAYITAPPAVAPDIARTLVEERLAACVNRLSCESVYRWEGSIEEEPETLLLAKTTDERFPALRERVGELHPHDVPCIERLEDEPTAAFAAWRADAVQ
jgi:periplasmic divalent cation tolerance protein